MNRVEYIGPGCFRNPPPPPPPQKIIQTIRQDMLVMCSVVDFGPGWYNLSDAFGAQRKYNPPGKSPALCSEF